MYRCTHPTYAALGTRTVAARAQLAPQLFVEPPTSSGFRSHMTFGRFPTQLRDLSGCPNSQVLAFGCAPAVFPKDRARPSGCARQGKTHAE
jgi:hypothetical protein